MILRLFGDEKVKINGDVMIYKGEEYDYLEFLKVLKHIKKAVFFILNQDIYIRKINIDISNMCEEKINKIKELEFGKEENFLIHYEVNKNDDSIYMYALSEGKIILKLAKNLKELKVIPIQEQYKKKFEKIVHKRSYQCIFCYMDIFYYLNVEDGYLKMCNVYKRLYEVLEFIRESNINNTLYVEDGIVINDKDISYVKVSDICNDKILFK